MQKYLRSFRIAVSILMLVAVGFLFLDFSHKVPSVWFQRLTWLQFVPSTISFFNSLGHGLALTAYGFLTVLVLTLLFGRVYCSYICPLGIFQDVIIWISRKTKRDKKKAQYRFALPKTWVRYSIVVVVCLSLLTGSIFLVNLLEPYSNFGRFVSDFFRPLYMLINNLLVKVLEAAGWYVLYPVKIAKTDPFALIVPAVMLLLVVWFSFRKGRLYCNTVCPGGTFLGLVSKISLFKIRIDQDVCNKCGKCMFACKSQCIDVKQQNVDFTRCVGCGDCLKVCDKNGIRYSLAPAGKEKKQKPDSSKRRFVAESLIFITAIGGLSFPVTAQNRRRKRGEKGSGIGTGNMKMENIHPVSPPGSLAFEHFTDACTACHLCVSACPTGVLKPSFLQYGFFGMMQPYMDYHTSFCNFECVKCTEVCPSKALIPLTKEEKIVTQIGKVRFIKRNCIVNTDETACGSCSEHCPTQAVKMVPYKGDLTIPKVNIDICVGCGACEYACPVTPHKAIIVDGNPVHAIVQKPEEKDLEEAPIEDFPF